MAVKPTPVTKSVACSECGLDWKRHGEKPTLETCIKLLLEELAKRPLWYANATGSGVSVTYPNSAGRPPTGI